MISKRVVVDMLKADKTNSSLTTLLQAAVQSYCALKQLKPNAECTQMCSLLNETRTISSYRKQVGNKEC